MEAVEVDQVNRPAERRRQIFDQVDPSLPVKRRCPGYSKIEVTLESGGAFGQGAKKDRHSHNRMTGDDLEELLLDTGGVSGGCVSHERNLWTSSV
jgi:hypothetical protein